MRISRGALALLLTLGILSVVGCASLQNREPIQVNIAGIEPLPSQGLELRMLVKLRIQNPNDLPMDFNGVFVEMDVQGKHFATGVSDVSGIVPRYGETVVDVPVSISALGMVNQAIGIIAGENRGKLAYELTGKLARSTFNSERFRSKGEFTLPSDISPAR